MLSSVAKPPPAGTQTFPRVTPTTVAAPAAPVATPAPPAPTPPVTIPVNPLPPKQVVAQPTPSRPQLSATTYVKLPPKTSAPGLVSLSGKPSAPPIPTVVPPQLAKAPELHKKPGAQHIPPIRLNEPVATPEEPAAESIFLQKDKPAPTPAPVVTPAVVTPEVAKSTAPAIIPPVAVVPPVPSPAPTPPPTPIEAKAPVGEPVSLDLFEKSQPPVAAPTPAPEAKERPAIQPPQRLTAPSGGLRPVRPPPLPSTRTMPMGSTITPPKPEKAPEPPAEKLAPPVAKPAEAPAPPSAAVNVAPPLLEKAPEPPPAEKLPPPLTAKPVEAPAPMPSALHIAPPMLEKAPEPPPAEKLPPPLTPKPVEAPTPPPSAFHVAPRMLEREPEAPPAERLPPPIMAKALEVAPPVLAPLHVAPPMLEKAPEPMAEKLAQPHLPAAEARKTETTPPLPEPPPMTKAPAMIKPESPPKPEQPPSKPRRSITSWLKKKSQPIVVSSTSPKVTPVPVAEAKPALKPPVLPARSMLVPAIVEESKTPVVETPKIVETKAPEKTEPAKSATPPPLGEAKPALKPPVLPSRSMLVPAPIVEEPKTPAVETPKVVEAKAPEKAEAAKSTSALPPVVVPAIVAAAALAGKKDAPAAKKTEPAKPPSVPVEPKAKKADVPLTRAERAKKRKLVSTIFFWALLFPATIGVLVWGSLRFGRDTRMEGQVIPPPGTVLSDEVWIVTDFRSLSSGITEDLAAERTPILQDIQERQDHVQRAQADVAAREERIRLIQEEVNASKADIEGIVKQARDATQKVWDVDGAQIDVEYKSRMDQLQRAIADRAKSLKLDYQPDPAFNSPEVWANAYRLALYQVPAGVDSVKEHAWLSDQMKQWRDFQKSMDDRTEALREQAAQIKLGPAPKIADLNSKMDELNQRIAATQAEEVPLKGELQQAQADLVTAQGADAGLDDKYYRQLYSLPGEAVLKRIPLDTKGRFTWVDDNVFVEGEKEHSYYIFARATRADGRQYWALGRISLAQNTLLPVLIEPPSFLSTKAILRPNLSPDEQEQ